MLALIGCEGSPAPADAGLELPADTWANYAQGFFEMYCTSCHSPTSSYVGLRTPSFDFRQYAAVQNWANRIRCGVAAAQRADWNCVDRARLFPIGSGPHPSDAERDRLAGWITAGLPE